jgi:hypothetical protein
MGIPTLYSVGPASGTYTAAPTANRIGVFMYGGGGGGPPGNSPARAPGGGGGFAFFNKPITQPFSQPYSVGGPGPAPGAGGNTTIANVGSANGGAAGPNGSNSSGAAGTTPGSSFTYPVRDFIVGGSFGNAGGAGGQTGGESPTGTPGTTGAGGVLVVFENTGT